MKAKYGFQKFTIAEFEAWIKQIKVARTIRTVQEHHTYIPAYYHFKNDNHFELQKGMKNHHVNSNGWQDIGQHFTTFPDGTILTGRSLEKSPACIYGFNANSVCMEHMGNFDKGKDHMTDLHKLTIIRMTAALCQKFSIPVNSDKIVYHHWFNLSNGQRNNGTGKNKSCPGTNFFGGNKVTDCETNFLPEVRAVINNVPYTPPQTALKKYVSVTASKLNIRKGPGINFSKVSDRSQAILGAILRVYQIEKGWYKISSSSDHWVSGKFTKDVQSAKVTASRLNARSGPGTYYAKVGSYPKGQELWIDRIDGGWCRVNFEDRWVSKRYLNFDFS